MLQQSRATKRCDKINNEMDGFPAEFFLFHLGIRKKKNVDIFIYIHIFLLLCCIAVSSTGSAMKKTSKHDVHNNTAAVAGVEEGRDG